MENHQIDNLEIQLQENIPLTEEEIKQIEIEQKKGMRIFVITLTISILFLGIFAALCVDKETLCALKYYDYIVFAGIGLFLFGFCYSIGFLADKYSRYNWNKDKLKGKKKLKTVIINRDKTEHAEYLTFAGPLKNQKTRIEVKEQEYKRYKIGSKVTVTYLEFSKKALEIVDDSCS